MFKAIRDGRASVVTDRIDTFTERGIRLQSGRELEADIIVTATGLHLLAFGGITLSVDGVAVNVPEKVAFKGFLLSDIPNFAYVFGYTNSSWTLKVGLVCEHFCRLLAHMDAHGHTICYPQPPASMPTRPFFEITSGYAKRAAGLLPHQGTEGPWRTSMEYRADRKTLREGPVDDDSLRFATSSAADALEPALAG
jgi:cation diffusion facilitator CzcD-associated flavoprotein CzcO